MAIRADGLTLNDVSISLRGKRLMHVNAHIERGDTLTLMGASGSGKSTLLSFIGGTLASAFEVSGEVLLDGERLNLVAPHKRHVGVLYQDALLFPHMSVLDNLLFAVPASIRGKAARIANAEEALDSIDMLEYSNHSPITLSGGQQARVALMRVLLSQPKALLLDEPFSKLDADRRTRVRTMVFAQAKARGLPILLVTHDEADAKAAGGEVITL